MGSTDPLVLVLGVGVDSTVPPPKKKESATINLFDSKQTYRDVHNHYHTHKDVH